MSDISQIDGAAIRSKRESQGWAPNDLATRACLSVKQMRQIEEGGMSAFYSESVKITAAKKVAALLDMSEAQLFGHVLVSQTQPAQQFSLDEQAPLELVEHSTVAGLPTFIAKTGGASLDRSEALHVLAQPPEHFNEAPVAEQETASSDNAKSPAPSAATADLTPASKDPQSESHWLKMLALFVVALAAAAVLQTKVLEKKPEATPSDATPLPVPADSSAVLPPPDQTLVEPAPQAANDASAGAAKPVTNGVAPSVAVPVQPASKPASSAPAAGE